MSGIVGIGQAPRRKEDRRFVTGQGNYVTDIKRADLLTGVFVRTPHAHALVKSIDKSQALATAGVLGVFTGAEMAADGAGTLPCGWGITGKDGLR